MVAALHDAGLDTPLVSAASSPTPDVASRSPTLGVAAILTPGATSAEVVAAVRQALAAPA